MNDDEPAAAASTGRGRRVKIATVLTVAGLFATLVFNTLGVWRSAQQEEEGRITQQISLLTTLNASATDAEKAINDTELDPCGPQEGDDARENQAASDELIAALDYYDYLAWHFNEGRLTVKGSRKYFGDRMIDGWRVANLHIPGEIDARYAQLRRFVAETEDPPPVEPC